MLLSGKSVVIYGATNPIGATVARAFAEEGAAVYLAGRSPPGCSRLPETSWMRAERRRLPRSTRST